MLNQSCYCSQKMAVSKPYNPIFIKPQFDLTLEYQTPSLASSCKMLWDASPSITWNLHQIHLKNQSITSTYIYIWWYGYGRLGKLNYPNYIQYTVIQLCRFGMFGIFFADCPAKPQEREREEYLAKWKCNQPSLKDHWPQHFRCWKTFPWHSEFRHDVARCSCR